METKQKKEIFKCQICGNVVEVLDAGGGELICCGEPMQKMEEKEKEAEGKEKHVPVVEQEGSNVTVKVGDVPHPMEEDHYIQWIELYIGEEFYERKFLNFEDEPVAHFCVPEASAAIAARAYCNKHGLWAS